jgi:hypothetical protein
MGIKNQHMMAKREKLREIELAKKANMWFLILKYSSIRYFKS